MLNTLLANEFDDVVTKIKDLISMIQVPLITIVAALIGIWGIYIAVKIAIANKNEDKVNAKEMVKQLVIGIIIGAVVIAIGPLVINILNLWATGNNTPAPAPTGEANVVTQSYQDAVVDQTPGDASVMLVYEDSEICL